MVALPIAALGLLGLASASPAPKAARDIPTKAFGRGFRLVVNVTDPSTDFDPPVHNQYINSIHVGAGLDKIGTSDGKGRIFYVNGTADEVNNGQTTVITDGGDPLTPQGWKMEQESGVLFDTNLNFGAGDKGISLSQEPYAYLLPETFLACNTSLDYYQGDYFITIKQTGPSGSGHFDIPPDCTGVRLLPECAELPELPDNATSNHNSSIIRQCYPDVSSIDWPQYS